MSLDRDRLKNAIKDGILNDPDGLYGSSDAQPTDSNELDNWCHYVAKAITEELDANASVDAGIEVEDGGGNKIGETRQSSDGAIS